MVCYYNAKNVEFNFNSNKEELKKIDFQSALTSLFVSYKCIALMVIMLLTTGQFSWAQSTANYAFTTNTTGSLALDANANAVDMSSGTTLLVGADLDDISSPVNNIGFNFFMYGNFFNQFSANSNGVIQLGGVPVSTTTYVLSAGSVTSPRIGALAADLRTGSNGKVHYKVVGAAPNRCLVIEFSNMSVTYVASPGSNDATYQVRLYESTGSIEYVYGSMFKNASITSATSINSGFSVGSVLNTTASITTSTNTVSNGATFNVNSYTASTNIPNLHSTTDGSRRVYNFTPPMPASGPTALLLSAATSNGMTLNWTAASPTTNSVRYVVLNSINGGTTYNFVANVALGTNTYVATGLVPSTNYDWKVIAVSEGMESLATTGALATAVGATYYWVGATGGNWNTPANWNTAADNTGTTRTVVADSDALIVDGDGIVPGGSTTINVDVASFTIGQLVVNSNTNLTLQSSIATTRTITINGVPGDDFVIEAGSSLNLNNATNAVAIAFSGTGNIGLIAGTLNIGGAVGNIFNSTGGTTSVINVAASGVINNTFAGNTGVTGSLATLKFLDGSAYNVSGATTGAPNIPLATWATNSTLRISGLTTSTTSPVNNNQSFGNIIYNCPSSTASYNFFGALTTATIKGDLTIQATGTGQFRTVSTGNLTIIGNVNVVAGRYAPFSSTGFVLVSGNTTIAAGSIFDLSLAAGTYIQRGVAFTNNGTINGPNSTTASNLYFFPVTPIAQTWDGVGTIGAALNSISINNTGGLTITQAAPITILRANLFSGNIAGSNNLTIGTGLALACTVQVGSAGLTGPGGAFLSQPTWNLGTGNYGILYSQCNAYTATNEIPPSRTVTNVTLNNTNGVTLSGGPLAVSGTLTLTAGNFNTSSANLLSLGTASVAGTLTGGSAASYVNGPFARTIASANANTNYILYPVGKTTYAPISLAPATTAISVLKAETFDTNSGTSNASIISLASNRRWEAPLVSGTITDINVRLGDSNLINGNIPVQANLAAGEYTSTFGATATFAAGTPNTIQSNSTVSSANYTGFLSYAVTNACTGAQLITTSPNVAICNGDSTVLSVSSANDPNHNYTWSPATGLSGTSGSSVTASPSVTTTYTITANDIITGCITTGTIVVTVNTAPAAVVVTPATAAICSGAIQQLDVSGGTYTAAVLSGSGANTTTGNVTSALLGPNPFQNFYGGTKQQWIYTAAELSALGFSAGTQINEIKLDLASANTTYALANLVVKMKNSVTSSFASTTAWETSLTTVKAAASYTPVVGLNSFVLDAPFTWNGTSNLVIEMNYSNNNGGGTGTFNTAKHSATSFVSTIFYRVDSQTAATIDAFVGTASFTYSSRNDITFVHTSVAPRVWSPLSDLYTDAGATIAYTGGSATTVYAKPTGNITYTATSTFGTCSKSNTSVITVTPITSNATTVSACDSYTWSVNGATYTSSGTYTNVVGCNTETLNLTITTATISGATTQVINGGVAADVTIEDIVVTANGTVTWFASSADAASNSNPLPAGTQLVDGNVYFGVSNIGICRSTTLAVTVTVVLGNPSFDLSQLNYYPNPVKDIFNVKYNKEIILVAVYDLTGRKIMEMKPNTLDVQLNMTSLSNAMYIVRLQSVDGITELKVYKN